MSAGTATATMAEESDSGQDRTLDPSAKRLADARKEGNVPRSRDLGNLFIIGASVGVMALAGGSVASASRALVVGGLRFDAQSATDPAAMLTRLGTCVTAAMTGTAPIFLVLAIAAVVAPLAIGGLVFVPGAAAPKLERLSLVGGFGRLFSWQSLVGLAKTSLLAILLAIVGGSYVATHLDQFASLAGEGSARAVAESFHLALAASAMMAVALAVIAAIDVPYQIISFRNRLRMTVTEMRDEAREMQGDPQIKARVRRAQRDMARRRMMAAVPKADVVVTNPEHFSVAIKYLEDRHRAPVVVAKGMDDVAMRIREVARGAGVPQLEAPPLARALYKHVEIGEEIPAALYTAVAQVLAYIFQLKTYAQGIGPRPVEPHDIAVPDGMDPLEPMAQA